MESIAPSEFTYCSKPAAVTTTVPGGGGGGGGDHFIVEDLLDFSNDDGGVNDGGAFDNLTGNSNSTDSSSVFTPVDSCNSSFSGNNNDLNFTSGAGDIVCRSFSDTRFSSDLCVPYEELGAELEWLSNFVEDDSFSNEDLQKIQLISGMTSAMKTRPEDPTETRCYHPDPPRPANTFISEMPVPGKARSKRSRTAPGNWASRLLLLAPTSGPNPPKPAKSGPRKKCPVGPSPDLAGGEVRRCLHCATDKTPQWRTGPNGPKTLCNACGVRFKSGRLVPEYRPASSPTFMLTKHSNSHRKVMELRRQKELTRQHQLQQQYEQHQQQQHQLIQNPNSNGNMMFDPPNCDDYLIHQHIGPDFRQLI